MTQQTAVPHIFAVGDVTGPHEVVHLAITQGEVAARNVAKLLRPLKQPAPSPATPPTAHLQNGPQLPAPDASQEFVNQFKKQLLPFLRQALDPKLLERGNEALLKTRIEELVNERLTADKVPVGRQLRVKLLGNIFEEMVGLGFEEMDYRLKALVTFTDPEIALVGLTEEEAKAKEIAYTTAQYPFNDHGKSLIGGHLFGFVKLIAETSRGEIIGGEIVGPHASDLIHELITLMHYRGTARELALLPHYHPTLAEILTYPAEEIADFVDSVKKK